jgi:hypothetical protein
MLEKKGRRLGAAGQAQHRGKAARGRSGFAVSKARAGDEPDLGSDTDASWNGKENNGPFRRQTSTYKFAPRHAQLRLLDFASPCAEPATRRRGKSKADASACSRKREEIGATPAKKASAPLAT